MTAPAAPRVVPPVHAVRMHSALCAGCHAGGGHAAGGTDGQGIGGVYNLGTFLADALTLIAHNHASDGNDDCFGC